MQDGMFNCPCSRTLIFVCFLHLFVIFFGLIEELSLCVALAGLVLSV